MTALWWLVPVLCIIVGSLSRIQVYETWSAQAPSVLVEQAEGECRRLNVFFIVNREAHGVGSFVSTVFQAVLGAGGAHLQSC